MVENATNEEDLGDSPVLRDLGIEPEFSEQEGPPVDVTLIRRYLEGELAVVEAKVVEQNISAFRSWFEACDNFIRRPAD
jgi:hypothetical protein